LGQERRLSGSGHVGAFCPKCEEPLELRDQEVYSEDIYEYFVCQGCGTKYSVHYVPKDWQEER